MEINRNFWVSLKNRGFSRILVTLGLALFGKNLAPIDIRAFINTIYCMFLPSPKLAHEFPSFLSFRSSIIHVHFLFSFGET